MTSSISAAPVLQVFPSHFPLTWTIKSVMGTGNFPNFQRIGQLWEESCPGVQIFLRQLPPPTLESGLDIKMRGEVSEAQWTSFLEKLGEECVFSPSLVILQRLNKAPLYLLRMRRDGNLQFHDLDTAGHHLAFETAELADMVLELTDISINVRLMNRSDKEKVRDARLRFEGG